MHAKIYIHFEYTLYTYYKWIRISCVTKISCEIGLLTVYLQRLLDVQAPGSRCFGYESLKLLRHILQLAGKPKYWKVIPTFKQFNHYNIYMFKVMSCLLVQIVYQTSILNISITPSISRFQWSPLTAFQPICYFLPACPADRRSWHRRSAPTSCQRVRYGCQRVL